MNKCMSLVIIFLLATFSACTVSPKGEATLREEAERAGMPYARPEEERSTAELNPKSGPEELVRYGLLRNGDVEKAYWEWRAAIERIPQEGTKEKNLTITLSSMIDSGAMAWDTTSLNVLQEDIMLPSKLSARAVVALQEARAAGKRFDASRFALRRKILDAYYDYALTAELSRLEDANIQLAELITRSIEARIRAGVGMQSDLLKMTNEVEMFKNTRAELQSRLPQQRAKLNALLGRDVAAELAVPSGMPVPSLEANPEDTWLASVAERNPDMAALANEIRAKEDGITRAKLEFLPDIELGFSANLTGSVQELMGGIMLPYLRYKAINGGIAQAKAELYSAQAMRRQLKADLSGELLADLFMRRDAIRQIELLDKTLLPRGEQIILLSRSAYMAGQASFIDVLDSQRSLIVLRRMRAELQTEAARRTASVEAITAIPMRTRD